MRLFWGKQSLRSFVMSSPGEQPKGESVSPSLLKKVVLFFLTILLCSSLVGVAQSPAPAAVTPASATAKAASSSYNGADAFRDVATAIETNLNAMKNSSGLASLGMYLVGFFFLTNFIWILVKGFMSGGGFFTGVLGDLVPLFIATGVTVMFLDKDVGTLILRSLDAVAGAITGLGGAQNATVAAIINDAAISTFSTLSNIWTVGGASSNVESLLGALTALPSFLLKLVAVAGTAFLIILALCVFFATLITSQVAAVIGVILAPMFVPFLMFKPAAFMFEGWMKFVLGAGMMKIVGLIMLQVTNVIMATLAGISAKAIATQPGVLDAYSVDIVLYCAMILLAGLAAYLMAQVPSIATGLISGSGGGAGFGGWANLASKSLATRGITGGMQLSGGGRGAGGSSGGRSNYASQTLVRAMPESLKAVTAGAGKLISAGGGRIRAGFDRTAVRDAGAHSIGRDTTSMSSATERSYTSHLDRANARQRESWNKSGLQGPPRPHVTLSKPGRTIDQTK